MPPMRMPLRTEPAELNPSSPTVYHRFRAVYSPFSTRHFTVFHPFITVFTVSGDVFRKVTF